MNIGTLTVTLMADMTQLDKMTTGLNSISQRFRTFGYLASTALTLPMVMAGKASFQMAKDFEFSMQKIVGLTGVAQSAVNEWGQAILKMGPSVAKGPKELAEALYYISSSGIKGAEAMNVLSLSARAATAGLGETKDVANVLTSALNAYRGTGLTAAYATDVLIAGVREGKAEAAGFATAIGQLIPLAAQLGVSFDQVAGGVAAVTLTGASAANAAVYMKGIFNTLITASTQGQKALEVMGSSYKELRNILSNQGLVPLMQKLRDMQVKWGDELMSDVIPNIRAMTFFLSFAGKNFQYNTELMKRLNEATGSLGKAFAAVADTIKVKYDSAISAAQVSLISLGKSIATSFLPLLESLVKKLAELTKWFNNLSEEQKRHKLIAAALIAVLGPLSLIISVLGYAISGLISLITGLAGAFRFLTVVMFSNPWMLILTAITGVVWALIHAKNKTEDFAKQQNQLKDTLIDVNGELKKMKDLTDQDYTTMSLTSLSMAYVTAWNAATKAKENYDNVVKARGEENKLNAWLKAGKYNILEEAAYKDFMAAKEAITGIADAMDLITGAALKSTKAIHTQTEALKALERIRGFGNDFKFDVTSPEHTTAYKAMGIMGADQSSPGRLYSGKWLVEKSAIDQYNQSLTNQQGIINELANTFEAMFKTVGGGFKGMINAMLNSLKLLLAELIGKAAIFALLQLILPGSGMAVKALTGLRKFVGTPGYANGTNYATGGMALVGERGPEFVNLPRGSQVLPNSLSGAALNNQMSGEVIFTIAGTTLVGVLQNQNRKHNSYR